MSKLTLGIVFGVGIVLAVIGVGAIVNWTVNYQQPLPVSDLTSTYTDVVVPSSGTSPLIGKHVRIRKGWAIKLPEGSEGVIVAVPGSDDYCGRQDGTSVRWMDFPSKDPSCHWMTELEIE